MKNIIDFFQKRDEYTTQSNSPEARVKKFISHWYDQWSIAQKKMGKNVDFEYWGNLVSKIDTTHFVNGSSSGSRNSFGSRPDFDPQHESITDCDVRERTAHVYTEKKEQDTNSTNYHVFDLHKNDDGNWLISGIHTLFHPPKSPVIAPDKHADILTLSDKNAPYYERDQNLNLNENILFQKDRPVKIPHLGEDIAKFNEIGKLRLSSGIIGILDFGYDIYNFEPLHKKVEPGEYSVETITIHKRIAGIRVLFSDNDIPVKWYSANTPNGNGVYGVDAGNLSIFDVESLLNLSRIEKERLFDRWCRSGQPEILSMTCGNDCVITSSGFGDGAYPAFWGVNDTDQVVSLYIDFMILVQEVGEGAFQSL